MGILYTFFLISGTLLRAFLAGITNTDFYILLSLFAIIGFITFRVFRPFFTFYPTRMRQKHSGTPERLQNRRSFCDHHCTHYRFTLDPGALRALSRGVGVGSVLQVS